MLVLLRAGPSSSLYHNLQPRLGYFPRCPAGGRLYNIKKNVTGISYNSVKPRFSPFFFFRRRATAPITTTNYQWLPDKIKSKYR
jgi:hypothetical protein